MTETLIARFFANADRLGSHVTHWFCADGRWVPVGWRSAAQLVRSFASGLIDMGHEKGNALAILSSTRREWLLADLGNMAAGGVTVGVYATMTAEQSRYIIAHSDARFLVVENAAQLAKIETVRAELPRLLSIIVIDADGVTRRPGVTTLAAVLERGRAARRDVDARADRLQLDDAATLIYTSGTTGPPKGAIIRHGNIVAALTSLEIVPHHANDSGFSFLPLAHALQRAVDYQGAWRGTPGAYARSLETVVEDLAATRPTVMAAVPRIFEKVFQRANEQAAAAGARKKKIFDWAVAVGRQASALDQKKQPHPPALARKLAVARLLVFARLRERLGGRVRLFVTGGAPIAPEILEFFHAAGITILEGWGMTETFAAGTLNLPDDFRFGSIGKPIPAVELRLDDDGELLVRGPNVFSGYYKDEEATRASFTPDGFFRTGDICRRDGDGFYYIIDRKKDLIITAAGKNIAPQNIENLIKSDPRISQVVAVGDRRPYLVALVAVAPELAGRGEAEVTAMVGDIIAQKNRELASYEQVKKFRLLPRELTQEEGELTPTLKVKRKVVGERYAALIESMYA
ncbi:MAG TPA: long-chain fatty acid--CoA ligase [Haliangiales bacterium]|nr:long-chain fatty acid--CoA ligase [Haliangiales bacterium]